jgi:hypothetical protein
VSTYTRYDFAESLNHADGAPAAQDVKRVIAAYGVSGDYAEWSGGFLMELKDGRYCYLTGWCDTTGWGCQDDAAITYFDAEPALESLEQESYPEGDKEWDREPADLNLWLERGAPDSEMWQ